MKIKVLIETDISELAENDICDSSYDCSVSSFDPGLKSEKVLHCTILNALFSITQ